MTSALMERSKTALAAVVQRLEASKIRDRKQADVLGEKVMDALGSGTAFATAAAIGLAEGRVRNRDGSALSLGPVPLTLAAATSLTAVSWFWNPQNQVAYAAAGAAGAYGYCLGKTWGTTWRAKQGVAGVGYSEDLTPEEHALVYGDD